MPTTASARRFPARDKEGRDNMERRSETDADRLLVAADLLLRAFESQDVYALIAMHIDCGRAGGPAAPGVFTQAELGEAMAFLVRMGLAEVAT